MVTIFCTLGIVLGETIRAGFINIHGDNSSLPVLGARWQCLAVRTQETAINVIKKSKTDNQGGLTQRLSCRC